MARPRAGAVSFVQRFDSALRPNVPLHVLWLDGVYGWEPGRGQSVFHVQRDVSDRDVQQLVQRIRDRVLTFGGLAMAMLLAAECGLGALLGKSPTQVLFDRDPISGRGGG